MNIREYFKKYINQSKKGFTMVEMIAVIAILAIASTATLSVFIAVQQTVKDTGEITTEQFNTTQIEKFIRNQFQIASQIDVYEVSIATGIPIFNTVSRDEENDEYMYFKMDTNQLYFVKYDDTATPHTVLVIDDVENVSITICPLDYALGMSGSTEVEKYPFKLIYKIETNSYTYSGGIVLGNTRVDNDENMNNYNNSSPGSKNVVTLNWNLSDTNNNDKCVCFRSMVAESGTTPP